MTIISTLTMGTGGAKTLARNLVNNGATNWTAGQFNLGTGAVLNNNSTFTCDTTLGALNAYGVSGSPVINNNAGGSFVKIATGTATINTNAVVLVFNQLGTVTSNNGELQFNCQLDLNNGSTLAGSGVIHWAGGTETIVSGIVNAAGSNIVYDGGTFSGAGNLSITGTFNWNSNAMAGTGLTTVAGTGTLKMITGGTKTLQRHLVNNGSVLWSSGQLSFSTAGVFDNNGTFTIDTAGGNLNAYGVASTPLLNNNVGGTIRKVSANAAVFNNNAVVLQVNNFGTERVEGGTLFLNCSTNVAGTGFLTAGAYRVATGTLLDFLTAIPTLGADIEIGGTGSVPDLATLATNRGRVGLTSGADLTLTPVGGTFVQEGIVDLSPDSVLTVTGSMRLDGTSQPVVRIEIASATSFGKLSVSGGIDLNSPLSTSRFDPDLVGGFDPALGARFDVIVAGTSVVNAFDSFQGGLTPSGRVLLATRPDAKTVAVEVGPGPLPPAPHVLTDVYEFETREAIVFTFDTNVSAFLSRKDFSIVNRDTNVAVSQSIGTISYNQASNQAVLLLTAALPNANYRMTIQSGDIANAAGVPASGTPITLDFFVLRGDVNRDKRVDFDDLLVIAQNYGATSGKTLSTGNVNYSADGAVGFDDLLLLAQNYQASLPALRTDSRTRAGRIADGVID